MIFVTGDCHSEFQKFSTSAFPEQREITKDDIVIIWRGLERRRSEQFGSLLAELA